MEKCGYRLTPSSTTITTTGGLFPSFHLYVLFSSLPSIHGVIDPSGIREELFMDGIEEITQELVGILLIPTSIGDEVGAHSLVKQ